MPAFFLKGRSATAPIAIAALTLICGAAAHAQTTLISSTVNNGSFEDPVTGTFTGSPAGVDWTFTGASGVSNDTGGGSSYGVTGGPVDGNQYGFLQVAGATTTSTVYQSFNLATESDLDLSYYVAGRIAQSTWAGVTAFTVSLDGTVYQTIDTTSDSSFALEGLTFDDVSAGNHTITFAASELINDNDNTALLDDVTLTANSIGSTATPEPGIVVTACSMFGVTGLGLVRGRLRRRGRSITG